LGTGKRLRARDLREMKRPKSSKRDAEQRSDMRLITQKKKKRKEAGCGNDGEERKKSELIFFFFFDGPGHGCEFLEGNGRARLWGRKKIEKKHMKFF
jgi:hypothetical protein